MICISREGISATHKVDYRFTEMNTRSVVSWVDEIAFVAAFL
jgi:hypothetical protein